MAAHSYVSAVVLPTCAEKGYTVHTCSVCSYSYFDTYTDTTDHNYIDSTVLPTCDEKGYTVHTCSVCGDRYIDTYTEPTGHIYYVTSKKSTCIERGYDRFECSKCGDVYTTQRELGDHSYENGICVYCGKSESATAIGDVNKDGIISILDVTEIQKHLANIVTLDDEQKLAADANGDDGISILDATQIQKYLANIVKTLG